MNTLRVQILKLFPERAKVLLVNSPQEYNINFGLKDALRNQPTISPEQRPCDVVWAGDEIAENKYGKSHKTMRVRLEGFVDFGENNHAEIGEQILGDLIKCFTSPKWDRRMGSPPQKDLIDAMQYIAGGVTTPKDGDTTVGAFVDVEVKYFTEIGDPYSR
jgi:hypothetical protein